MKKLLCVALSMVLLCSLFAGCKKEEAPVTLQVGYAKVDISPSFKVPMTGYGDENRYSEGVQDKIYTTCTALRDSTGNTVLIFHNDLCTSAADPISFARKDIEKELGISRDNIMVSSTHTHHSVDLGAGDSSIAKYKKQLRDWMVEAAKAAIADLKNAKMHVASVETEGINFTRHYVMKDGSVAGDNFGDKSSGYKDYVRKADPTMQFIKFTREGAKDVLLVNFATHPHRAGGMKDIYNKITSDIVGIMRQNVEEQLGCNFAYFTGAAGDVNPSSKFTDDNAAKDYIEQGKIMADYAKQVYNSFTEVPVGKLQVVKNVHNATPKEGVMDASDIIQYAISVGEVAFVFAPYEMFNENGEQIMDGSPFKMTFVCTLSNEHVRYIPSTAGFEYDGLLSYGANAGRYAKGTGDTLAAKYVEMLKGLYGTK